MLKPIHSAKWPSTGQHDSTKTLALGKVATWRHPGPALCRVPDADTRQSYFAESPPLGTRQSAGPGWRHVAALPSAKALGKVFAECPKSDTRQRSLCRGRLCRVAFKEFAECKLAFAECNRHSAKPVNPVVNSFCTTNSNGKSLIYLFMFLI